MVYRSARYVLAVVSLALGACSSPSASTHSSSSSSGGSEGPPPTLTITSPEDGAVVVLDFAANENDIDGTVETTNFKVAAVGQPGDGQVWIIVDGPQCNEHSDLGVLLPYNTTIPSDQVGGPMDGTSFQAGVDYCFQGPLQDITAELHRDDGSLVASGGKTVSSSITVTVVLGPLDGGTEAGADAPDGG
jgi:hypothetical protein